VTLAAGLGTTLAAGLAAALATALTGCTTSFSPPPLQRRVEGECCRCGGDDEEIALTYSWSRNLMPIYCILDLFLRPGWWWCGCELVGAVLEYPKVVPARQGSCLG
jgi:hypothetical protein